MSDNTNVGEGLVLHHLQKLSVAEKKKDEAVATLRAARKAAKADGVSLKTLDAVRHLLKRDEHEIASDFNEMVRYGRFLNVPLYSQLDFFQTPEANEKTALSRAYADGVRAGKLGEDQSGNPHDVTAPAGQEWLRGYQDGQAILATAIKQLPPTEPKAKKGH